MMKNHEYWLEIESLPVFETGNKECWNWLEKLQQTKLTQLQLIQLKGLLQAVCKAGEGVEKCN